MPGSAESYTFFGQDVYAYTGARLAAGVISFEQVGPVLAMDIIRIPYQKAVLDGRIATSAIPILNIQYGNVWTNIDKSMLDRMPLSYGDTLNVEISREGTSIYKGTIPFVNTFGDVPEGKPLA